MDQQESIQHAKQYLEDILSFFGINADVEASVRDEFIELKVPSTEANSILIGRNAETLRSLQYLVSTMLRNSDAALHRVNVDIADYKQQRADKLEKQAGAWLEDMRSASEGEGRDRKLIISQKSS